MNLIAHAASRIIFIGAVIFAVTIYGGLIFSSSSQTTDDEPTEVINIDDWLYMCSPLLSRDGRRSISFSLIDHKVEMDKISNDQIRRGILYDKNPIKTLGKWVADENSRRVTVSIDGADRTYSVVDIYLPDACIIVWPSREQADIEQSWFGEPTYDDGDKPD